MNGTDEPLNLDLDTAAALVTLVVAGAAIVVLFMAGYAVGHRAGRHDGWLDGFGYGQRTPAPRTYDAAPPVDSRTAEAFEERL